MIILHFHLQPQFKMNYFIISHHFTPQGRYELNKLTSLAMCGFIAQLVEQRTGNAEVTGSNPVEALIFFFRLLLSNCLNWKIYCDDYSSLSAFKLLQNGEAFLNKTVQNRSVYHFFVDYQGNKYSTLLVRKSNFTIQCPFVLLQINPREYTILVNKTLLHNTTGRVYPLGKYDLNGEKAVICPNYTNYKVNYTNSSIQIIEPNITAKTESRFLWYVTFISVSVAALILTLVIHFIFAELRRPLPGKNLMSLCLALALAQFMWLFGSGHR